MRLPTGEGNRHSQTQPLTFPATRRFLTNGCEFRFRPFDLRVRTTFEDAA